MPPLVEVKRDRRERSVAPASAYDRNIWPFSPNFGWKVMARMPASPSLSTRLVRSSTTAALDTSARLAKRFTEPPCSITYQNCGCPGACTAPLGCSNGGSCGNGFTSR